MVCLYYLSLWIIILMVNCMVYLVLIVFGSIGLVSLYSYSLLKSSLSSKLNKNIIDHKTRGDESEFGDSGITSRTCWNWEFDSWPLLWLMLWFLSFLTPTLGRLTLVDEPHPNESQGQQDIINQHDDEIEGIEYHLVEGIRWNENKTIEGTMQLTNDILETKKTSTSGTLLPIIFKYFRVHSKNSCL